MQTIARCLSNPIVATIVFVVANIAWVRGVSEFIGPQVSGIIYPFPTETPRLALQGLECPFILNRDGQGLVVATVANPYNRPHGYTVAFEITAYGDRYWQKDIRDRQDDYWRNDACREEITILPEQIAKASCVVNRPEIETDSIIVIVYAYSDHDTSGGIAWSYESSYKGACLIQSGRIPISPTQTQALLSSVIALLVIGWVFAIWQHIGPINQILLIIGGLLAWGLIMLQVVFVSIHLALLLLLLIGVVIVSALRIPRSLANSLANQLTRFAEPSRRSEIAAKTGLVLVMVLAVAIIGTLTFGHINQWLRIRYAPSIEVGLYAPAGDYKSGHARVPTGKLLFVEGLTGEDGIGECGRVSLGIPAYLFDGELLHIRDSRLRSRFGYSNIEHYPLGLVGYGRVSQVGLIETLPFQMTESLISGFHDDESEFAHPDPLEFVIHSIDADGAIVVETMGRVMKLDPGRKWIFYSQYQSQANCRSLIMFTLMNHGLLDWYQIASSYGVKNENP